jgi:hypothetical protein
MTAGLLALVAAAFFAGAAFYVGYAEHPARLALDDAGMLAEWKASCRRGFVLQAPLCVLGCLCGLVAWWQTGGWGFAIGAVAMIASAPWTVLTMIPINRTLTATDAAAPGSATRALVATWAARHAVRTGFGAVATLAFFAAALTA